MTACGWSKSSPIPIGTTLERLIELSREPRHHHNVDNAVGLLRALPEEINPHTRKAEFRALAAVASEASREYLQSVVDSPSETDIAKSTASEILKSLQKP